MGAYLPLFSVEVEHTYFSRGYCPGLEFVPTTDGNAFIKNTGLLIRHTRNGVHTFFDRDSNEALQLYIADPDQPQRLVFKVYNRERLFRAYTELSSPEADAILYFDNKEENPDADNRFRMHKSDYVSAENFEGLDTPRISGILSGSDRLLKPEFIASVWFGKKEIRILGAKSEIAYPKYYIRFQARETFWKYYLLGNITRDKSFIVDLDSRTEFEDTGQASLPGNRNALTFRSKNKIPLRENSGYRFQLKSKDPNGGKIIIRRLPVASADQFCRELIEGEGAIVSEIYINC
jgi:hypothetical protein